jgi:hypothetical protein
MSPRNESYRVRRTCPNLYEPCLPFCGAKIRWEGLFGGTHVGQRPPAHGGEGLEGVGVGGVGVLELRSATAVPEELNS